MVVGLTIKDTATASTVSYNGSALTYIGSAASPGLKNRIELWYLKSPPSGTANISVTLSSAAKIVAGAISYSGVSQLAPLGTFSPNSGISDQASTVVNSTSGEVVFAVVSVEGQAPTTTVGAGQTEYWNLSTGAGGSDLIGSASTEPGSASTTLSWAHASSRDWAIGAVPLKPEPINPSGKNILFTTRTGTTPNTAEQLRVNLLTSWGHTLTYVEDSATQATYDAAIAISDVAYVSEESTSTSVASKLTNACIGVVTEEIGVVANLGFCTAQSAVNANGYSDTAIYINDVSHYITAPFAATGIGDYTIFTSSRGLNQQNRGNSVSPDAIFHAWATTPTNSNLGTLVTMETGAAMIGGGTTPARRVMFPFGSSQNTETNFSTITANGETIMRRAVDWAAANNGCYRLQKRSYLPDGTPLPDGSQLAAGTEIKFLIYINNRGNTINDISIQDILDPAFLYKPNTLQIDNSLTACASSPCTTLEEQSIYNAAALASPYTDDPPPIDADGASFNGTDTINVGDGNVAGNGQVNVSANSVFALLFSVTLN